MSECEGIRDRLIFRVCGQSRLYPHNYESEEDFTVGSEILWWISLLGGVAVPSASSELQAKGPSYLRFCANISLDFFISVLSKPTPPTHAHKGSTLLGWNSVVG